MLDKKQKFKAGDVFTHGTDLYILSQVDGEKMALISLFDGNRWHNPEPHPRNVRVVTYAQFAKIAAGYRFDDWTYVGRLALDFVQPPPVVSISIAAPE